MGDTKSKEFQQAQAERRELVQLAVEEVLKETGLLPSGLRVAEMIGTSRQSVLRDWDILTRQGKLPSRNRAMPRREPGRNLGTEGGGTLLEAEGLLRAVLAEIGEATPEYLDMSREFWVTHLEVVSRVAEEAIALAMGATVDDLIGQIRKEER